MTEAEWLICTDPAPMLEFLRATGTASARQLRLFACACCRAVWSLLTDKCSRRAVEVAERFADGQATPQTLLKWHWAAYEAYEVADESRGPEAAYAANCATHEDVAFAALNASVAAAVAGQCDLLRDIFGDPFRVAFPIDRTWLGWNEGIIPKLVRASYEERALPSGTLDRVRLAVRADALEEAGCTRRWWRGSRSSTCGRIAFPRRLCGGWRNLLTSASCGNWWSVPQELDSMRCNTGSGGVGRTWLYTVGRAPRLMPTGSGQREEDGDEARPSLAVLRSGSIRCAGWGPHPVRSAALLLG